MPLFDREPGGVSLNEVGQRYYDKVWQALALIGSATSEIRGNGEQGTLRVSILPSFASLWLLPRLPTFRDAYPDVTIAIETSNQLVDFSHGYSDVAIRFGSGKYPGLRAERLLCESSNVVCTPSTLSSHLHDNGGVDDLDIARLRFVNDRGKTGTALKPELSDWLRANEREESEPKMDTAFSDSSHAIQHVLRNGSFMLARRSLVDAQLRDGSLVAPLGKWIPETSAYFAVYPEHRELRPVGRLFLRWLKKACADDHLGCPTQDDEVKYGLPGQ